ncbi:bifunctional riboflavin kinase/FAD synthetase [Haloflavibacter putidus]|uniref:Riboflavin biosynthesis protein n=1 Tax=Haloflavibacter putidus TaxID=2576776 RepID=A0A507ZTM8_9FLAO|nr:bifunctional riboflavin kinase/FAD synthetase [Haloflavibacter putidus]TQD36942.1 bifunctional riboflavin kinase/FAD synthetase [Haloflavibacter putidus]
MATGKSVVTIGTFDGVHIGHRKILKRLIDYGGDNELTSTVLTFFPHPRMVLQKEAGIKLINTIEERKQILYNTGIDKLIVHPFTREFSRLKAQEYIEEILVKKLDVAHVIIGYDHRFGRNRTADITDLKKFGKQYGFSVEEISKQDVEEVAVSSTKIRKALNNGEIEKANKYLSKPFILTGTVISGKGLGKGFGYPTANLKIEESYKIIPANGVYVVKTNLDGKSLFGMMNIGTNPTVGGKEQTIETYFLDFDQDLYGKKLQIEILSHLRKEVNFDSTEKLVEAMQNDEKIARQYIAKLSKDLH